MCENLKRYSIGVGISERCLREREIRDKEGDWSGLKGH